MRSLVLAFAVILLASACVTITPVAQVASAPTSPPQSAAPIIPTAAPSGASSPSASIPAPATGLPTDDPTGQPTHTPNPPSATPATTFNSDDPACADDAFTLEGFSWSEPYEWRYNSLSTPSDYKSAAVVDVVKKGIDNVISERNDCGRPDAITAQATYLGDTIATPCTDRGDGANTIGFGDIPSDLSPDTIAFTCPYTLGAGDRIVEADIVISTQIGWSLDKDSCFFSELLEPTITHEMGHVLGLGHVSERQHPDLTMSTSSNGPCDDVEATLGLGDMLGLESLYAPAN